MKKKGTTEISWSNFTGVILAIVGLSIIFFYVAPKLYDIVINQDARKAKNILNTLDGRINSFLESDLEELTIVLQGFSPDNENQPWMIVAFDKNEQRPDKCFFNSCICTCPNVEKTTLIDECQNFGFCKEIKIKSIKTNSPILYAIRDDTNTATKFSLGKLKGYKSINRKTIPITTNLMELNLSKNNESLTITHHSEDYENKKYAIIK